MTFTTIASPATNSYLDTTPLLGVQYYYQVAATNISGTSAYSASSPASIVAALPGQLSLGELRLRAQQRADMVGSNFVNTPEWNFFINQAYYELYDILITVYEDYYIAPRLLFSTDGVSQLYDLPNGLNYTKAPAFYKMYGMDVGVASSTNAWVTIKKFNFIQRNRFVYPNINSTYLGVFNLEYRVIGSKIMFIPIPAASQSLGMWYFPRLTTLLQDTDIMDGISGWTEYPIIRAAKYALDKQEDPTDSLAQELADLKQRIEDSAQNRDAGQGDSISNARTYSERWGGYGGGCDGNSGGW